MELSYELKNGLRKTTEADIALYDECQASAISLARLWEDVNDAPKIIKWDKAWEEYLEHRAKLIDTDGRAKYLPWNVYRTLDLQWLDGYDFVQNSGDCVSFGHRNSLKASNFTNALRTGRKPIEIAHSMTYALCRGDGRPQFGSGANLLPMAKYAADFGNFWTADFGRYDTGAYCRKYDDDPASDQRKHARQTQSIIVFLPDSSFDTCYKVVSAGFGINIGTGTFIGGSAVNKDGLAQVNRWDHGAHSTALIAGWEGKSGERYIYNENSHPTKYASDSLNDGHQWGCWLSSTDFRYLSGDSFDYGNWYVNIGELPVIE